LPREFVPKSGTLSLMGFISVFKKYDEFYDYDTNKLRDGTLS